MYKGYYEDTLWSASQAQVRKHILTNCVIDPEQATRNSAECSISKLFKM